MLSSISYEVPPDIIDNWDYSMCDRCGERQHDYVHVGNYDKVCEVCYKELTVDLEDADEDNLS